MTDTASVILILEPVRCPFTIENFYMEVTCFGPWSQYNPLVVNKAFGFFFQFFCCELRSGWFTRHFGTFLLLICTTHINTRYVLWLLLIIPVKNQPCRTKLTCTTQLCHPKVKC